MKGSVMRLMKLIMGTIFIFATPVYSAHFSLGPTELDQEDEGKAFYVFEGQSTYNINDWNYLHILGVKMNALEQALSACKEAGNLLCVLKSAIITVKAGNTVRAKVVVHSIDHYNSSFQKEDIYKKNRSGSGAVFDRLSAQGVKFSAIESAIALCQEAGHFLCILQGVYFLRDSRNLVEAEALVIGYSLQ